MKDYRVEKDEHEVKHYYVRAEGQWVEVEKEVYSLYETDYKSEYRRRIEESEYEFISIEKMMEDCESDDSVSAYVPSALQTRSAEEECFEYRGFSDNAMFMTWFRNEVRRMPTDRRALVNLYLRCNCSTRRVADKVKLPRMTVYRYYTDLFQELRKQYTEEVLGNEQ